MNNLNTHQGLSQLSYDFVKYANENEEMLNYSSYETSRFRNDVIQWKLQPWPMFLGNEKKEELVKCSVEVLKLIKKIPDRIFKNDPQKISDFYGYDLNFCRLISLVGLGNLDGVVGRADLVESANEFKCIEYNLGSNVGGWESVILETQYLNDPPIQSFLADKNVDVSCRDSLGHLFHHVIQNTLKTCKSVSSELNIAIINEEEFFSKSDYVFQMLNQKYKMVLESYPEIKSGQVRIANFNKYTVTNKELKFHDRNFHAILDFSNDVPLDVLMLVQSKNLTLYNGPATGILTNKLNIALLSEHEDSNLFSEEERQMIKKYIPWSRRLTNKTIMVDKQFVDMDTYIRTHKDKLVLKVVDQSSGDDVYIGRSVSDETWGDVLNRAKTEKNWIVQELLDPTPYHFLLEEGGSGLHDVVWGTLIFGETYAGGFIRVLPQNKSGVVNRSKGATECMIFEVNEVLEMTE